MHDTVALQQPEFQSVPQEAELPPQEKITEKTMLDQEAAKPSGIRLTLQQSSSETVDETMLELEVPKPSEVTVTIQKPEKETHYVITMPAQTQTAAKPRTDLEAGEHHSAHLVVLLHGLWGKGSHMAELANNLQASGYKVLVCTSYEGFGTCSGAELCAERAMGELDEMLMGMGGSCKYISIIAYSFGGLIARYMLGLLSQRMLFDTITPVNFITLATPHLGVRHTKSSVGNTVQDALLDLYGPFLGGVSIKEMSWRDSDNPEKAMLAVLSDPKDHFLPALALFPNRVAIANARGDPLVSYTTAAMASNNPYTKFRIHDSRVSSIVKQEPCRVVSVTPHPEAFSEHINKYDAFGLTNEEPLSASKVSVLRHILSFVRSFVVGVVGLALVAPLVFLILIPMAAIRNRVWARSNKRELALLGLTRRNKASLSRRRDWRAPLSNANTADAALRNIEEHAPFSRVAVLLDGFNTHDTIVARSDGGHIEQGKLVCKFAVENCMRAEP